MHHQLFQLTRKTLLLSFLLIAFHLNADPTGAQSRRYNPPRGGEPPITGRIGGTRSGSCTGETATAFTALAPSSHVGQTAASHPTFVLYVPESQPLTIDFRLYVYGAEGEIEPQAVYRTEISSSSGIMPITLPETEPGLRIGRHYYWQAALICNPNRRSEDLIVGAELQTVNGTSLESERWYDLLRTALNNAASQPHSASGLLVDLAMLERSASEDLERAASTMPEADRTELLDHSQGALQQSQRLTQIVDAIR